MTADADSRDGARGSEWATVVAVRAAAAAAEAARGTPGVLRLQPGVWGLMRRFSQELWERATGQDYPDTAGVDAVLDGEQVRVEITLVTEGHEQAAAVVRAVQQAARHAVTDTTGLRVSVVAVHVTGIDVG